MAGSRKIATFLFLVSLLASLHAQNLSFGLGEWVPYTGQKLKANGMAVEIVSAACAASGMKASFAWYPWRRAEAMVLTGEIFGTFPYTDGAGRRERYLFTSPLFHSRFAILVNPKNPRTEGFKYSSPADFKDFKIGVTAGTDQVIIPLQDAGGIMEETPEITPSILKLAYGRLDFVVDDRAVILAALSGLGSSVDKSRLKLLESNFGEERLFRVMASSKYPESALILSRLDAGLAVIRQNGTYAAILAKYGLSP